MKKNRLLFRFTLVLVLVAAGNLNAQEHTSNAESNRLACAKISASFLVPARFDGIYGNYRSPLKFYNGDTVLSVRDWKLRRKEILDRWSSMMGKWPAFITQQQMEILETSKKEGYTQQKIRFNWVPGEKTVAYLLIPDKKGKKAAVITTYYEPETAIGLGKPYRDFAYQLVKRGFVSLSIGTTETSKSQNYAIYYPSKEKVEVQPLSMLAYAAANAWYLIARLPDVDSTRIGIMGHSYGGKWSMFASCLFEKFACAVWSDAGIVFDESKEAVNYWEPWYLGYHPKPWRKRGLITKDNPAKGLYVDLVSGGTDLHELHSLMAPRPFLVSGGSEDPVNRWIPLNHTIQVNNLLGFKNRVAMTNRPGHAPDPESNEQAFLFLACFLQMDHVP